MRENPTTVNIEARYRLLMYHSAIRRVYWVIQVEQPPTRYKWDDDTDIEGIRDQSMSRLPHQTPPFWPWSRKIWPKQPRPHSLWPETSKISKKFTCLLLVIISEVWVNILIITIFWLEMIRNNIVKSFICLNPINAAFYKTKMHHSFWTTFGNSVHSAHCRSSSILCSSYTHVIFTSSNRLGTKIVFTVWLFL